MDVNFNSNYPSSVSPDFSLDTSSLKNLLSDNSPIPYQVIISELKKDPVIKTYYQFPAGVSEGYTIEEHTQRVLDVFFQFYKDRGWPEECPISPNEFLLFLALHDIGKGQANKETALLADRKDLELKYTQEIIERVGKFLQIDNKKLDVFKALLAADTIGNYLKIHHHLSVEVTRAAEEITSSAKLANMDPIQFLELMILFHKVDSYSYPTLFTLFEHDSGQNVIEYKDDLQKRIKKLQHRVQREKELEALLEKKVDMQQLKSSDIKHAIQVLSQNRASLTIEQLDAFYHLRSQYKQQIKEVGKDHPLYHELPLLKKMLKKVEEIRLPYRAIREFKHHLKQGDRATDDIKQLTEKKIFKNAKVVTKKIKEELIQAAMKLDPELLKILEQIKWIHGTNTAIFAFLPYLNFCLTPTGTLLREKVAPLSGEITGGGVSDIGVNQGALSGESIRSFSRAWDYALSPRNYVNSMDFNESHMKEFAANLSNLIKTPPANLHVLLIKLIRFQQWDFVKMSEVIRPYADEIKQACDVYSNQASTIYRGFIKALKIDNLADSITIDSAYESIEFDFLRHKGRAENGSALFIYLLRNHFVSSIRDTFTLTAPNWLPIQNEIVAWNRYFPEVIKNISQNIEDTLKELENEFVEQNNFEIASCCEHLRQILILSATNKLEYMSEEKFQETIVQTTQKLLQNELDAFYKGIKLSEPGLYDTRLPVDPSLLIASILELNKFPSPGLTAVKKWLIQIIGAKQDDISVDPKWFSLIQDILEVLSLNAGDTLDPEQRDILFRKLHKHYFKSLVHCAQPIEDEKNLDSFIEKLRSQLKSYHISGIILPQFVRAIATILASRAHTPDLSLSTIDLLNQDLKNYILMIERNAEQMKNTLFQEPKVNLSASDREWITNPAPLLLVTTKVYPEVSDEGRTEYIMQRKLSLGKDIDLIFTDNKSIERVKNFLQKHGLQDTTQVLDAQVLEQIKEFPLI
ncbi:MAG: hypothetical protein K0S74_1812 [Chlamydiales bacterium]|jgi:hypothetical protein|nr:hypothetical protein [Chlamydiales bacterium]